MKDPSNMDQFGPELFCFKATSLIWTRYWVFRLNVCSGLTEGEICMMITYKPWIGNKICYKGPFQVWSFNI